MPKAKEPANGQAKPKTTGKGKNKGGRPRAEINWEMLEKLCAIQCTGEECASVLGISYDALVAAIKRKGYESFPDYFKRYSASGKASLRRQQFRVAEKGNATMLIWLGKQYLGQRDYKVEIDEETSPLDALVEELTRIREARTAQNGT